MMSEILLSMLMALLPVRNVSGLQIFTSSFSCFLKRNLIVETLCIGTEKAFNINAGKCQLFPLIVQVTGAVYTKVKGCVLDEKSSFKKLGLSFN